MSEEIDPQTQTEQQAVEAAWDGSYSFLGEPLPRWDHVRARIAQAIGMKCPGFTEEDIDRLQQGLPYAGQLDDVAIFFWLLTLKEEAEIKDRKVEPWSIERAHAVPGKARKAAFAYAAEKRFSAMKPGDPDAANWTEAARVFWAIFNGIEASKFVLESDTPERDTKDSREKKV